MPHPFPLATVFTAGMRRDVDRTELPGGSAYNMVDFIPDEIQAINGGRGGWTYAGSALTGATKIQEIGYSSGAGVIVALDSAKKLWNATAATSIATAFTTNLPTSPPFYHRGYLIFPNGNVVPSYYKSDGTTGTLSAAPACVAGCAYKDHSCVVASDQNGIGTQRVYFSAAGDPTTWDTSYGWWDTTGNIVGIAGLLSCIVIFHADSTERLRGTTPPPGSDMTLEPFVPNVGCIDVHSIAYWSNRVVWASSKGIHMTDGATVIDLTENAQMSSYWSSLMSGYSSTWRIAAGVYRDHYIVSINNGSTLVDCLCVSLKNQTMWRLTNLHGSSFTNIQYGQQEKLYMGQWNAGRVAELSSLWSPSATVKRDGDSTNPTPIIETAMFRGYDRLHRRWIESMGKQKWRWAYVDYDLRDAATDNPTAAISYCTTPAGSYTQAGLTLSETTAFSRVRRALSPTQGGGTHSQMLGLKFAVTGPYSLANLYAIEGDFSPIDIGAL